MTTEILIMNERGAVMAADSAATAGDKVFTADKIFRLSDRHPVGVMVYGLSEIGGVAVDILVHTYRRRLGDGGFGTLGEYADDFMRFQESRGASDSEPPVITDESVDRFTVEYVLSVLDDLSYEIGALVRENEDDDACIRQIALDHIDFKLSKMIPLIDSELHERLAEEIIIAFGRTDPEDLLASDDVMWQDGEFRCKIVDLVACMMASDCDRCPCTGLVFVGYGTTEYTPSYTERLVHGVFRAGLIANVRSNGSVDSNTQSFIVSFAQDDTIRAFLDGISPGVRSELDNGFQRMMDTFSDTVIRICSRNGVAEKIDTILNTIRHETLADLFNRSSHKYLHPALSTASHLSVDEMASLAVSMISSSALRNRMSDGIETVGGPIDVAALTYNNGFVWVKNKNNINMGIDNNHRRYRDDRGTSVQIRR